MAEPIVSINNLTRKFGAFTAVDHISMEIDKGEVFGFLGPNGSGKTTTIRMLCGILNPSSGEGRVSGYDIITQSELIKFNLGYMSQKFSLYNDLTVLENLEFYAGVFTIEPSARESVIKETIVMAGLQGREKQLVANISSAVKQRLALGSAILHRPKILFLDEPTGGVDPVSRRNFWEVIYGLADRGITIMVTTHYMDEAELCTRLAFIYEGRLIAQGAPSELRNNYFSKKILSLDCENPDNVYSLLEEQDEVCDIYFFSGNLHVIVDEIGTGTSRIEKILKESGTAIHSLEPISPSLEDVFISLVEENVKSSI